ncbi:MAG: nucleotidyltransferase domain-containing protein [Heliobacteriaceae bacterium]|jgi:predicted nucleotidyltransferase|nr:nucleotidyltransferase domain-containing protein [Heliobacteriaceae bacterium]
MIKKEVDKIAQKLKTVLQDAFDDFEGLYLFGSHAKENAADESDIDIVAVLDVLNREKFRSVLAIAAQFVYDYGVYIDMHPMTRKELEHNYIFHNEVVNKGIFYAI